MNSTFHSSASSVGSASTTTGYEVDNAGLQDYRGIITRLLCFTNQINSANQKKILRYTDIFYFLFNFLQVLVLTVDSMYPYGTYSTTGLRYLSYLNLNFYSPDSYNVLFIIFSCFLIMNAIIVAIVVSRDNNSNLMMVILVHILFTIRYIFYIPISNLLLMFFKCSIYDWKFRFYHDEEIIVTDFPNYLFLIFGGVIFLILFSLSFYTSTFIFSRYKSIFFFTRSPNSRFSTIFFLFQTIILLFTILFSGSTSNLEYLKIIASVFTFSTALILQLLLLRYVVFYNRFFLHLFVTFLSFCMGNAVTTLFSISFRDVDFEKDFLVFSQILTPQIAFALFFNFTIFIRTFVFFIFVRILIRKKVKKSHEMDEFNNPYEYEKQSKKPWYLRTAYDVDIYIHTIKKEERVVETYKVLQKSFEKDLTFPLYRLLAMLENRKYKKKKVKKGETESLLPPQNFTVNSLCKNVRKLQSSRVRKGFFSFLFNPPDFVVMVYITMNGKDEIDFSNSLSAKQNHSDIRKVEKTLDKLFDDYVVLFNLIFHIESGFSAISFSRLITEIEEKESRTDTIFKQLLKRQKNHPKIIRKYAYFLKIVKGNLVESDYYFTLADELEKGMMNELRRDLGMVSGSHLSKLPSSVDRYEEEQEEEQEEEHEEEHEEEENKDEISNDLEEYLPRSVQSDIGDIDSIKSVGEDNEADDKNPKPDYDSDNSDSSMSSRHTPNSFLSSHGNFPSTDSLVHNQSENGMKIVMESPTPCSLALQEKSFTVIHEPESLKKGDESYRVIDILKDEEKEDSESSDQSDRYVKKRRSTTTSDEEEKNDEFMMSPNKKMEERTRGEEVIHISDDDEEERNLLGLSPTASDYSIATGNIPTNVDDSQKYLGGSTQYQGVSNRKRGIFRKIERRVTYVFCMKWYIVLYLLVNVSLIVFVFVMALQVVSRFEVASTYINAGALNRKLTVSVAFHAKQLQVTSMYGERFGMNVSHWLENTKKICGKLEDGIRIVYSRPENTNYFSEKENSVILDIYSAPESTFPLISQADDEIESARASRVYSLIDGLNEYVKYCNYLSSLNETGVTTISKNVAYLFVTSNMETLLAGEIELLDVLISIEDRFVRDFLIVLIVVPVLSAILILLTFLCLYVCVCLQRNQSYQALRLMPKDAILELLSKFNRGEALEFDKKKVSSFGVLSYTEKLFFKFFCVFSFSFLLMSVIVVGGIVSSLNFSTRNIRVEYSGRTRMLTHRIHYYATELLYPELAFNNVSYSKDKIVDTTGQISEIIDAIRFGDDEIPSSANFPELTTQWNDDNCDFTAQSSLYESLSCLSLSKKYNLLIDSAYSIMQMTPDEHNETAYGPLTTIGRPSLNNTYYQTIYTLDWTEGGVLQTAIQEMVTIFEQSNENNLVFLKSSLNIVLSVGLPLFLIFYFFSLCGVVGKIGSGIIKIKLMFLMFPIEVVMRKEIYQFLTSRNVSGQRKRISIRSLLKKKSERKRKTLVDLLRNCNSMTFFLNRNGNIVHASNSSVTNLGFSQETDIMGKLFSSLFFENRKIESWLKSMKTGTQGGQLFDAEVKISNSEVESSMACKMEIVKSDMKGLHYLVIMRNVMQEKRNLELISKEKEYSENLLLNIFPKEIASIMKQKRQMDDSSNKSDENNQAYGDNMSDLVVATHNSVSVLFSDMVGFTKFSSQISPETLIGILNGLFCSFDDICDTFKMEKIKTIGNY